MPPIRSGPLPRPVAISPAQVGDGTKLLNPSAAALAKALAWHHKFSDPGQVKAYHQAFQAALANDGLRAEYNQALGKSYPEVAAAVAGSGQPAASGGGWVPGARSPTADDTGVAANWLAEMVIRQARNAPPEAVKASYDTFRGALANDQLRATMDRYLVTTDRAVARDLGLCP